MIWGGGRGQGSSGAMVGVGALRKLCADVGNKAHNEVERLT